jgi:hypothetical protein
MFDILNDVLVKDNQTLTVILLCLATFRIYLEVIGFDFTRLPMTKALANRSGEAQLRDFHRMGLIFSVGYIILFAPSFLLS